MIQGIHMGCHFHLFNNTHYTYQAKFYHPPSLLHCMIQLLETVHTFSSLNACHHVDSSSCKLLYYDVLSNVQPGYVCSTQFTTWIIYLVVDFKEITLNHNYLFL